MHPVSSFKHLLRSDGSYQSFCCTSLRRFSPFKSILHTYSYIGEVYWRTQRIVLRSHPFPWKLKRSRGIHEWCSKIFRSGRRHMSQCLSVGTKKGINQRRTPRGAHTQWPLASHPHQSPWQKISLQPPWYSQVAGSQPWFEFFHLPRPLVAPPTPPLL